jgi:hypothetical protein
MGALMQEWNIKFLRILNSRDELRKLALAAMKCKGQRKEGWDQRLLRALRP